MKRSSSVAHSVHSALTSLSAGSDVLFDATEDDEFYGDSEDDDASEECEFREALEALEPCLSAWLRKVDLVDCAPALAAAGVRTLSALRSSPWNTVSSGSLLSPQRAKTLMRAARLAPREASVAGYVELLSDAAWLEEAGLGLCVVEPAALRGLRVDVLADSKDKAYARPRLVRVAAGSPGLAEPVHSTAVLGQALFANQEAVRSKAATAIAASAALTSLQASHAEISITEKLAMHAWSKSALRVKCLGGSAVTKVFVSLGDTVYVNELRGTEVCEVDICLSSKIRPIGLQLGELVFAFCGTGRSLPQGPTHHADAETQVVFPTNITDDRELLWRQGYVEAGKSHFVDPSTGTVSSDRTSASSACSSVSDHWSEVFAASALRRLSI